MEFEDLLARYPGEMKVEPGLEESVQIVPLIDQAALKKWSDMSGTRRQRGPGDGQGACRPGGRERCFFEPTVLLDTTEEMLVEQEENFGRSFPSMF